MGKHCIAYEMEDAIVAKQHMNLEPVYDYGDYAFGHYLHTWDDGKRVLYKCVCCGGYVLMQKSEYHSFSDDGGDSYYTDYFFLDSLKEADELNRRFDGYEIEREYGKKYLCVTNGNIHWSRK